MFLFHVQLKYTSIRKNEEENEGNDQKLTIADC